MFITRSGALSAQTTYTRATSARSFSAASVQLPDDELAGELSSSAMQCVARDKRSVECEAGVWRCRYVYMYVLASGQMFTTSALDTAHIYSIYITPVVDC